MVDEDGVVNATFDMVEAYTAIYTEMKSTAGATTADLNKTYAELLTAKDQRNMDVTEMLENASGMTYDALGQILSRYNIRLEDALDDAAGYGLESTGFGKVRLTNWEAFAKKVFKTEDLAAIANTPEYISAFKAYNDGLIELNKNTEKVIVDEVK